MRTATTSLAVVLAAALLALAGSLTAAAPASAKTVNDIWKHLEFPAVKHSGLRGCVGREIFTGPGRYRWRLFASHSAHQTQPLITDRVLHLRRARYKWLDCWQVDPHGWDHFSYLQDLTYGGLAWLYGDDFIKGNFGNGLYHIGSKLDNVRSL